MKTFKDRLMEMPLTSLEKLHDREQRKIRIAQRDLDTIESVIIARTDDTDEDQISQTSLEIMAMDDYEEFGYDPI